MSRCYCITRALQHVSTAVPKQNACKVRAFSYTSRSSSCPRVHFLPYAHRCSSRPAHTHGELLALGLSAVPPSYTNEWQSSGQDVETSTWEAPAALLVPSMAAAATASPQPAVLCAVCSPNSLQVKDSETNTGEQRGSTGTFEMGKKLNWHYCFYILQVMKQGSSLPKSSCQSKCEHVCSDITELPHLSERSTACCSKQIGFTVYGGGQAPC